MKDGPRLSLGRILKADLERAAKTARLISDNEECQWIIASMIDRLVLLGRIEEGSTDVVEFLEILWELVQDLRRDPKDLEVGERIIIEGNTKLGKYIAGRARYLNSLDSFEGFLLLEQQDGLVCVVRKS